MFLYAVEVGGLVKIRRKEVKMVCRMDKKWFRAAGIRALKTVAQTFVATVGTATVIGAVDWKMVLSASALAGILSIATSVAGLPECKEK